MYKGFKYNKNFYLVFGFTGDVVFSHQLQVIVWAFFAVVMMLTLIVVGFYVYRKHRMVCFILMLAVVLSNTYH